MDARACFNNAIPQHGIQKIINRSQIESFGPPEIMLRRWILCYGEISMALGSFWTLTMQEHYYLYGQPYYGYPNYGCPNLCSVPRLLIVIQGNLSNLSVILLFQNSESKMKSGGVGPPEQASLVVQLSSAANPFHSAPAALTYAA